MHIQDLMIEVTRGCQKGNPGADNACTHCIRGKQQSGKTISFEAIDAFLKNAGVTSIGTVMFGGGEPSLFPEAIEYFIQAAEKNNVSFNSWWISTNGELHKKTPDFVKGLMRLEMAAEEQFEEVPRLQVSTGVFHNQFDLDKIERFWNCFSFVNFNRFDYGVHLFDEGFAEDNGYGRKDKFSPEYSQYAVSIDTWYQDGFENYTVEGDEPVYLAYDGNFSIGCNFSYERFDSELIMGNVFEIKSSLDFVEHIISYGERHEAVWEDINVPSLHSSIAA